VTHTHPDSDFTPRCPRCKYAINRGDFVERGHHLACWKERGKRRRLWFEAVVMTLLLALVVWLARGGGK
jgi:hypothetical protein